MDDKDNIGKQDRIRINVNEVYELQYWKRELNVTAGELCKAIQAVGVMADDVRNELNKRLLCKD